MKLAGNEVSVVTRVKGSEIHSDNVDGFATGSSDFFERAFEWAFRSLSNKSVGELELFSSSIVA